MSVNWWDRMMVETYFREMELLKPFMKAFKWKTKENEVNLSLLQRPKKIKAGTRTAFVYAPSEVTVNDKLDIGSAINILDVFEGATPAETTLKVMRHGDWKNHVGGYLDAGEMQCTTRDEGYNRNDSPCHCHMEPSEMPKIFRNKVQYVLLTDVGK